jgi:hypothetical protein
MKAFAAAAVAALVLAAGALAATSPTKLVVKASQVAKGYVLVPFSGGQTLKRPTLSECNLKFPSEKLRLARDQVTFQRGQLDPAIANEIVRYKTGGAAVALRDARAIAKRCPKGAVTSPNAAITTVVKPLKVNSKFLPGYVALEIHVFGTVNGKNASLDGDALYQRRGDVLSGVYAYGGDPAVRKRLLQHTAAQSAAILRSRG